MRSYGWLPDVPDGRDYIYKRKLRMGIPKSVDLRPICSAIENQGELGSCTAQAIAGNIELLDNMTDGRYTDVSRLFIYYNERRLDGSVEYDAGAYIRDGIKAVKKWGVCDETMWPYNIKDFAKQPTWECYDAARPYRISSYERLQTIADIQSCLCEGYPINFGIPIYDSFQNKDTLRTGYVPMPKRDERVLGGHAMLIVGYEKRICQWYFIIRNSWGKEVGIGGYFYIPFQYIEKLGDDFWVIKKENHNAVL